MAPRRWVNRQGALQNGQALRALRVERKLNRPEAARLIGCHPKTLAHLERESRGASDVMIQQIADAYRVKPAEFTKRRTVAA